MTRAGSAMFATDTLKFSYPANWTREVEESPDGLGVTLQSPGVSFAILGIYEETEDPQDLVEQAVDSLREEHPSLEVEEIFDEEFPDATNVESMFISLDTVSYCWIRGWQTCGHTLLVYLQSIERESATSREIFQAICKSVSPHTTAKQ